MIDNNTKNIKSNSLLDSSNKFKDLNTPYFRRSMKHLFNDMFQ